MAWGVLEQRPAVLHRILVGRLRQLVDQGLHDEGRMAVPDRAPPQDRDASPRRVQFDPMVRDLLEIRRIGQALDRCGVDTVLDRRLLEQRADQDRLPHNRVLPGQRLAVGAQADAGTVQKGRPIVATAYIVLARPYCLDRRLGGLRHLNRLGHEIGREVGAPAESAAEECGMDVHLLGLEAGDPSGDLLVHALELRPSPDLALASSEPTVQFSGSIGACARYGTAYSASMVLTALPSPSLALPASAATAPGVVASWRNCSRSAVLSRLALGPRSQSILSASRPSFAAQK